MINEAFFLGRFVREPKLSSKEKEDGTLYWVRFRIAVNRNYAKDGEADYFNCVAYHAKAKHLVKYGKQGGRVFVKGRLRSGSYEKDGKKYSHTIDPRTGYPVSHSLLSATIVTGNAADADAYATYCMVIGLEEAKAFISSAPDVEGYLIYDQDGQMKEWASEGFNIVSPEQ